MYKISAVFLALSALACAEYDFYAGACLRAIGGLGYTQNVATAADCMAQCGSDCAGVSYGSAANDPDTGNCWKALITDTPFLASPCNSGSTWDAYVKKTVTLSEYEHHVGACLRDIAGAGLTRFVATAEECMALCKNDCMGVSYGTGGADNIACYRASYSDYPFLKSPCDSSSAFDLYVKKGALPEFNCPSVAPVTGASSATVTFDSPSVQYGNSIFSSSCSPASGTDFSVGDTEVTCSAYDQSGREYTCKFNVQVTGVDAAIENLENLVDGLTAQLEQLISGIADKCLTP